MISPNMNRDEPAREPPVRMNHLSPWDMSGLGMGFGLYRPRRPSYTYATQTQRQRSESYRYAVRKSASDLEESADFIEGVIQRKNRKESYVLATRAEISPDSDSEKVSKGPKRELPNIEENVDNTINVGNEQTDSRHYASNSIANATNVSELDGLEPIVNNIKCNTDNHIQELKAAVSKRRSPKRSPYHESPLVAYNQRTPNRERNKSFTLALKDPEFNDDVTEDSVFVSGPDKPDGSKGALTPCSENGKPSLFPLTTFQFNKNLILLCSSFILLFSAFRAIQNLQSSLNNDDHLGIIAMTCVHGTMFLSCLWAPAIINTFTAKWTLSFGMFSFILWIGANFYPRFYTLIPFGIIAGMGQGILWTAESSYILKLAFDSSRVTKDGLERSVFRFHGIFLACFQTTHIWGNLISSIVLSNAKKTYELELSATLSSSDYMPVESEIPESSAHCGVLYPCHQKSSRDITKDEPSSLWQLMTAYISLAVLAFCLVLLCLDKIGAKVEPEKSGYEIVVEHVSMILTHKTFRLLVPLLIFSGLQQGFVFSDFNQAYVKCAMGEEYIGYCMIVLGLANVVSAILVALCANLISREVVFGIGGIIHMGLMIGLLIWIPEKNLAIFFILSASWGLCDAVWQTQCNTLICITCPEDTDSAFANYRMLQSFGLTMGFLSGTYICVSFKLYILMILLVVSIMFYVLAEYKVRQVDDENFEENAEENIEVH